MTIPDLQSQGGFTHTTNVNLYPGDSFLNSNLLPYRHPRTRVPLSQDCSSLGSLEREREIERERE